MPHGASRDNREIQEGHAMMDLTFWVKYSIVLGSVVIFFLWFRKRSRSLHDKRTDTLAKRERERMR